MSIRLQILVSCDHEGCKRMSVASASHGTRNYSKGGVELVFCDISFDPAWGFGDSGMPTLKPSGWNFDVEEQRALCPEHAPK